MTQQYAKFRDTAKRLVSKWGKAITLSRPGGDISTYNTDDGSVTLTNNSVQGVGLFNQGSIDEVDGTTIETKDRVLLFVPDTSADIPKVDDTYATFYRVIAIETVNPDDSAVGIIYTCLLRG